MKKLAKAVDCFAWKARNKMMDLAVKAKESMKNEDGDTNFISIAIILVIVLIVAMIFIAFWNRLQPIVVEKFNEFLDIFGGGVASGGV